MCALTAASFVSTKLHVADDRCCLRATPIQDQTSNYNQQKYKKDKDNKLGRCTFCETEQAAESHIIQCLEPYTSCMNCAWWDAVPVCWYNISFTGAGLQ